VLRIRFGLLPENHLITARIDLEPIDGALETPQPVGPARVASRLNDVMIMLERHRADVETVLRDVLPRHGLSAFQLAGLTLEFEENAPALRIAIPTGQAPSCSWPQPAVSLSDASGVFDKSAVEREIAQSVADYIKSRANPQVNRRWQPVVVIVDDGRPTGAQAGATLSPSETAVVTNPVASGVAGAAAPGPPDPAPVPGAAAGTSMTERRTPKWWKTLLWLLAAVVLGAAYLMLQPAA